jgi:hypothetical protein
LPIKIAATFRPPELRFSPIPPCTLFNTVFPIISITAVYASDRADASKPYSFPISVFSSALTLEKWLAEYAAK